ncbi:hypothetical protein V6D40_01745, partial [Corynebacterium sp. Q4381]|uniref:hypothetical protein n=1 Tax=Corynebacterium sp. Marseille-Q4381 TaxID=3121597 RepID=UPI002FE621FA
ACVKHAASVHPEPGSNSPQKHFSKRNRAVKSPNPTKTKPPNKKRWTGNPLKKRWPCIRRGKTTTNKK